MKKHRSGVIYKQVAKEWDKRKPKGKDAEPGARVKSLPLIMTVLSVFRYRFAIYAFLSVVISLTEYLNAWIMKAALTALKDQPDDVTFNEKLQGVGKLVFALIASKLVLTIVTSNNLFHIYIASNKITNSINGLIFNKIKKKSLERDKLFSLGEITNLS